MILQDFARFLNSDRYQYTESDVFLHLGQQNRTAVFEFFFRKTEDGGFAVVAGVDSVIDLVEILNKASYEEKKYYFSSVIHEEELLEFLCKLKFTGNIYAMADGELVYPGEPVIVVEADLIAAKIIETPLLNAMNYQMAIASKASRVTRAANGKGVLAFGPRRAHGFDASVLGSRAALIGGCFAHSALATEHFYGYPSLGTMSHSYIQAFGIGSDAEYQAFLQFLLLRKQRLNASLILLVDTYETLAIGLPNAIRAFKAAGIDDQFPALYGIRIDSGDLAYLSKKCRAELDKAGLTKATITLTNGLDEESIINLQLQGACFDFLGVGDSIAVSKSNPCFGGVYKMVAIDNEPVLKVSNDMIKTLTPHHKEIYRIYQNGEARADLITLKDNDADQQKLLNNEAITITSEVNRLVQTTFNANSYTVRPLLRPMVLNGQLTAEAEQLRDLKNSQQFYKKTLASFSNEHSRLLNPHYFKVDLSEDLYQLKTALIKRAKL